MKALPLAACAALLLAAPAVAAPPPAGPLPPPAPDSCAAAPDPTDCLLKKLDQAAADHRFNQPRTDFLRKRVLYTRRLAADLRKEYDELDGDLSRQK